jgi:predicted outer membrane repeat protein
MQIGKRILLTAQETMIYLFQAIHSDCQMGDFMRWLITIGLILAMPCVAFGRIINIPADYSTIQAGVDASNDGDTVLVAPGVYQELINFGGHECILASYYYITNDTTFIGETIIDGDSAGTVVTFAHSEGPDATITGFTIRRGFGNSDGGGILCDHSSPKIMKDVLTQNYCNDRGGAIFCSYSTAQILDNVISNNFAPNQGAGIYCDYGGTIIRGNLISHNRAKFGAGVRTYRSECQLFNNVIFNNAATSNTGNANGGGLYCDGDFLLVNNVVTGNTADDYGGGIVTYGNRMIILNTVFWGNSSSYGPQVWNGSNIPVYIAHCDIQGGWQGEGNIDSNPYFYDPPTRDYRLQSRACGFTAHSPCIDAGHHDVVDSALGCHWGLGTEIGDMGAFGGGEGFSHICRIINVPDDYESIQEAINVSLDGDTVLLQPGVYHENIQFSWHDIVLGSRFLTSGDTSFISSTIMDGQGTGPIIRFNNGGDSIVSVVGLTITNGWSVEGGAIRSRETNPTIKKCVFRNNAATYGGAIFMDYTNMIIDSCVFSANHASVNGGAVYTSSSLTIVGSLFLDNTSDLRGGAFYGVYSAILIEGNSFLENSARFGGAMGFPTNLTVRNNYFSHNTASEDGGAIVCDGRSMANLVENHFVANYSINNGGAIYVSNGSAPHFTGNAIDSNAAYYGAGIYCSGDAQIINNTITHNRGPFGAGVYCASSSPLIAGNTFRGNDGSMRGAGIYCYEYSYPLVMANLFYENEGASIFCYESSPWIINNVVAANHAEYCAGIYSWDSHPEIRNCIFWDNSTESNTPDIFAEGHNTPSVAYCDIQQGYPGEGVIHVDPLFRNRSEWNFHLMSATCGDAFDSPCIDTGWPDLSDSLLDCFWGLGALRSDIGAYGGNLNAVGIEEDYVKTPGQFQLLFNYPNPFNSLTNIRFSLPQAGPVQIEILDLLGREIETIIAGDLPAGEHDLIWDASGLPSGLYFARLVLKSGESSAAKMMLLK